MSHAARLYRTDMGDMRACSSVIPDMHWLFIRRLHRTDIGYFGLSHMVVIYLWAVDTGQVIWGYFIDAHLKVERTRLFLPRGERADFFFIHEFDHERKW